MFDIKELENIDRTYHWILNLVDLPSHPLKEIIMDFYPKGRQFFQSAYMYLGTLPRMKSDKKICIIHFNSDLNGHNKFMNIQNIESYRAMFELIQRDIIELSINVTRDSVIDLSKSDALTTWHLNEINKCHYFYITDETGFVQSYPTHYNRG